MNMLVPAEIRRLIDNQVKKNNMKEVAAKIGCSASWISSVLSNPKKKVQKALLNQVINSLTAGNGLSITLADIPSEEVDLPVAPEAIIKEPAKIKIKAKKEKKDSFFKIFQKIFKRKPKFSIEESLSSLQGDMAEMKKDIEELKKLWTN